MIIARTRVVRVDRLQLAFDVDARVAPGRGVAQIDATTGYLEVDTYIARDGVLVYSDGTSSWGEYRSRAELDRCAATFDGVPITDDHPPVMLDAGNHREYARGVIVGRPRVVTTDGVSYLLAHLSIRDAELVQKVRDGQRELSIGAFVDVVPRRGVLADGTRYDAEQLNIVGNHLASVDQGRAGPECGVVFDGRRAAVYHAQVSATVKPKPLHAASQAKAHAAAGTQLPARGRADEAGAPVTETEINGPEGTPITVPTWLASAYEYACANGWSGMGTPASSSEPAAPAADEAELPPPAADDPEKKPEEPPVTDNATARKPAPHTPAKPAPVLDAAKLLADAKAQAKSRSRLDRNAIAVGVPEDKVDSLDDVALARMYVAKVMPHLKAIADKAEGVALDALVEAAHATPREPKANPFAHAVSMTDAATDELVLAHAELLAD